MSEYLTVEETARRLKVDPETVRRWLREGTMRGQKFGRVWRVPESELVLTPRAKLDVSGSVAGECPQPA